MNISNLTIRIPLHQKIKGATTIRELSLVFDELTRLYNDFSITEKQYWRYRDKALLRQYSIYYGYAHAW